MAGSLLRKFGRGLALVGLELRVRLFGFDLKPSATPTDGQVLGYVAADQAWQPITVSGGGSLPSGSTGSLLRHNGTAYVSYSIGTAGQVLRVVGGTAAWSALAASDVGAVPTARAITAGTGLSGGGDLSSDRTLSVATDTTLEWETEQRFLVVVDFQGAVRSTSLDVSGTTHTLSKSGAGRIRLTNTAARAVTLPASGNVVAGDAGLEFVIHDAARTADSAAITITAPSGVTLNGVVASSVTLDTKGGAVVLRVVGANTWETVGL